MLLLCSTVPDLSSTHLNGLVPDSVKLPFSKHHQEHSYLSTAQKLWPGLCVGPELGKDREALGHDTDGILHRPFSRVPPDLGAFVRVDPAPSACAPVDSISISDLSKLPAALQKTSDPPWLTFPNLDRPT